MMAMFLRMVFKGKKWKMAKKYRAKLTTHKKACT